MYVYVCGNMLCGVSRYAAAQFYIVPRTGVFTTYTGLNTGLQRGHPTAIPSVSCVVCLSLRCRSLAFRALAQSHDLLGVLQTK